MHPLSKGGRRNKIGKKNSLKILAKKFASKSILTIFAILFGEKRRGGVKRIQRKGAETRFETWGSDKRERIESSPKEIGEEAFDK